MLRHWFSLAVCVFSVAFTAVASAQEYEYELTPQGREHRGVFLRASAGVGYTSIFSSSDGQSLSIGGVSSLWNLAVGGSVTERLALHAVYTGADAFAPHLHIGGKDVTDSGAKNALISNNIAGGLTFYTRRNGYVSAHLGLAWLTITDLSARSSSSIGPGVVMGALAGKEWFVARELGIGFAMQLNITRVPEHDGANITWTGFSLGPMFSLTYN